MADEAIEIKIALDDGQFQQALDRVNHAVEHSVLGMHAMVEIGESMFEMFESVVGKFNELIQAALEAETANRRLEVSLAQVTDNYGDLLERQKELNMEREHSLGINHSEQAAIQAYLLNLGVVPEALEAATRATIGLADATGKDMHASALKVAKVFEGNIKILEKSGIKVHDLDEAFIKLDGTYVNLEKRMDTAAVKLNVLAQAEHHLKEIVGEAIVQNEQFGKTIELWLEVLHGAAALVGPMAKLFNVLIEGYKGFGGARELFATGLGAGQQQIGAQEFLFGGMWGTLPGISRLLDEARDYQHFIRGIIGLNKEVKESFDITKSPDFFDVAGDAQARSGAAAQKASIPFFDMWKSTGHAPKEKKQKQETFFGPGMKQAMEESLMGSEAGVLGSVGGMFGYPDPKMIESWKTWYKQMQDGKHEYLAAMHALDMEAISMQETEKAYEESKQDEEYERDKSFWQRLTNQRRTALQEQNQLADAHAATMNALAGVLRQGMEQAIGGIINVITSGEGDVLGALGSMLGGILQMIGGALISMGTAMLFIPGGQLQGGLMIAGGAVALVAGALLKGAGAGKSKGGGGHGGTVGQYGGSRGDVGGDRDVANARAGFANDFGMGGPGTPGVSGAGGFGHSTGGAIVNNYSITFDRGFGVFGSKEQAGREILSMIKKAERLG